MLKSSILTLFFLICFAYADAQNSWKLEDLEPGSPAYLAQQQLDAYNARDIEAFMEPYSDSLEIYNFPNQLNGKGKENIKPGYAAMFERSPNLHCELVNRIVLGNTVIDQEKVTGIPGVELLEAIAIYKIENGKIAKVYFMRKE